MYVQFSDKNRCMCGLVYVRFEKVDIHTVLMGTPCSVLYSSLKNN